MKLWQKICICIVVLVLLLLNLKAEIIINNAVFDVNLSIFTYEKVKGLGKISFIDDNQGMFFFYFNSSVREFWMKDMQFPIDVLWIKDNKIVNISENVPIHINGEITRMNSLYEVDRVLELKANNVSKNNIKIGDEIIIKYKLR